MSANKTTMSIAGSTRQENVLEEVHDHLYNNLYLLTKIYPASKKMIAMLNRGMFVKNNKAASQEVLYYLLNVADHNLIQDKITFWRPRDIKEETKFRGEILQCIDAIKSMDQADLPLIVASHLISPGGFKFAFFIYKLSKFVIYMHLKKTHGENILRCPKKSKASNISFDPELIQRLHQSTESQITTRMKEHENYVAEAKEESKKIVDELRSTEKKISELEEKYKGVKAKFDEKYPSATNTMESLQKVKTDWDKLSNIHQLFQECNTLISYLTSNDLVLKHNGDHPMECIKKDELDLIEYFKSLNSNCEKIVYELPNPTGSFLAEIKEKVNVLMEKTASMEQGLELNKKEFQITMDEVSKLLTALLTEDPEEV